VGDRRLVLGGHARDYGTDAAEATRGSLVDASGGDAITVLLAHRPDTVLNLPPSSGVDLTVAGHTHGGQVVVPGFGPLITMSQVPRAVAEGGLHEIDGNRIYVSPGVGMERRQAPQVRLFSPPTIAVLTLAG
jgi:predicted MPP superfamily phosphohydrolase